MFDAHCLPLCPSFVVLIGSSLCGSTLLAQEPPVKGVPGLVPAADVKPSPEQLQLARSKACASAMTQWVIDFESGRIQIHGVTSVHAKSDMSYVREAVRGGVFGVAKNPKGKPPPMRANLSHFTLLQRLVGKAEKLPSAATVDALLTIASTGFAHDMFNHQRIAIRDLGHFALMRMSEPVVWQRVFEVATTEIAKVTDEGLKPIPVGPDQSADFDLDQRTMWRVAAIRLLGMKNKGVFRKPIENCLKGPDPRVRLAAAEALTYLRHPRSLPALTAAMTAEKNPMVVVQLVQATQRLLNKQILNIPEEQTEAALMAALGRLNDVGWRTDMAIVQLIHNHPIKAAVERFIGLMRQSRGEVDPILKIINENASRFLGLEAHRALRRITGAIIEDDPDKWEKFWAENKDKVKVRRLGPGDKTKTFASFSGGSFYGIPVLGNEVVFVIDTSGSMKAKAKAKIPTKSGKSRTIRGSRLAIAKRQTLKAIQGMPQNSKFSIVTFNSNVHSWNRKPVKARKGSRNTASSILSRLKPSGGTNVFDALVKVLEAQDMGYGAKPTSNVDEIFVLSDGQPSGGVLTDPDEILKVIGEINKIRKIRIHTVYAGEGGGSAFMQKLATQNGGKYVQQ